MKRIWAVLIFVIIQKSVFADVWGNNLMTPGEITIFLILLSLSLISVSGFVISMLLSLFKNQFIVLRSLKIFRWSAVISLFIFGIFSLFHNPVFASYFFIAGIIIGLTQFIPYLKQLQQQQS